MNCEMSLEEYTRIAFGPERKDTCGLRDFPTIVALKERIEFLEKQAMGILRMNRRPMVLQYPDDPRPPKIEVRFGKWENEPYAEVLVAGTPFGGEISCYRPFFSWWLNRRINQAVKSSTLLAMHNVGLKELDE